MNGDELKTMLSDDTLLRALLAAQTNGGASGTSADSDRFTLLCMLSRHLPPKEKALAERILLALLLMSLVGHDAADA